MLFLTALDIHRKDGLSRSGIDTLYLLSSISATTGKEISIVYYFVYLSNNVLLVVVSSFPVNRCVLLPKLLAHLSNWATTSICWQSLSTYSNFIHTCLFHITDSNAIIIHICLGLALTVTFSMRPLTHLPSVTASSLDLQTSRV